MVSELDPMIVACKSIFYQERKEDITVEKYQRLLKEEGMKLDNSALGGKTEFLECAKCPVIIKN